MTTGEKIQTLRRERGMTQEHMADCLEVSRQAVSKWEADAAFPETDKLVRLAELFGVSVDYLLRGRENAAGQAPPRAARASDWREKFHYEYRSKRTLFGLPLVHVNVGLGAYRAHGILSVGMLSAGFLSVGLLSAGLLSFGTLSLGLIAFGALSLGGLSLGAIAAGLFSLGAIAIGLFAMGAIAVGLFSAGALAVGQFAAVGDWAFAQVAVGFTKAQGSAFQALFKSAEYSSAAASAALDRVVPPFWTWMAQWIKAFL